MMTTQSHDDDMPKEVDFSSGTLGRFYHKGTQLLLPIHLEVTVQNTLAALANAKGVELSVFVNNLLKEESELIQMSR